MIPSWRQLWGRLRGLLSPAPPQCEKCLEPLLYAREKCPECGFYRKTACK